jgi:SAM domain (Sterile alpha motif)
MPEIADWLQKLGLGQYAQRFAENDIDVSVLRHLTDADLEKIGVSLGHRRKILAAIAELHGKLVWKAYRYDPTGWKELSEDFNPDRANLGIHKLPVDTDPEAVREVRFQSGGCAGLIG